MTKFTTLLMPLVASVHLSAQMEPAFLTGNSGKIHYLSEGKGGPPVVFVSGMAHDVTTWRVIQDRVSRYVQTISYDRAGLGLSEYHGEKKDLATMVQELDAVVNGVNLHEPVIFVGHSLGCEIIKLYASLFPKKVKGMVLIDPGYDPEKLKSRISDSLWQEREAALKKYQPEFNKAQQEEYKNIYGDSKTADSVRRLPKVPVVLFTATMVTGFPASAIEQQVKKETHLDWLKYMPYAEHIYVGTSWHYIHVDEPALVIKSIRKMIGN